MKSTERLYSILILSVICFLMTCQAEEAAWTSEKINGVNVVAIEKEGDPNDLASVERIGANWVAFTPFALMEAHQPEIHFDTAMNWFGHRPKGLQQMIVQAKQLDLNVLLKPHFRVNGNTWAGDLDFSDADWNTWQKQYTSLLLDLAKMADSLEVEMLCIGTEMKSSVQLHPGFWSGLIAQMREVYAGKITYAANWDNYQNITFWNELDYIGIDAYFPLSEASTPSVNALLEAWGTIVTELEDWARTHNKPVIFTEYGYRSIDKTAWQQWEIEAVPEDQNVNHTAQQNAYEAVYLALWNKPWMAGGFLWKWWPDDQGAGGLENSNYTPQHKPVEAVIRTWYNDSAL